MRGLKLEISVVAIKLKKQRNDTFHLNDSLVAGNYTVQCLRRSFFQISLNATTLQQVSSLSPLVQFRSFLAVLASSLPHVLCCVVLFCLHVE